MTDADILETINKNMAQSAFFGTFIWVPVVDGSLIVQRPSEAFKQGKVNSVSLIPDLPVTTFVLNSLWVLRNSSWQSQTLSKANHSSIKLLR